MASEIKINVAGLVYNQSVVGTYGLVLSEEDGNRRFSVMIGEPEAQSIALKMNNKKSPRPLTHDLILTLLSVFGAKLEKVLIYDMVNDVFYSELHLKKGEMSMVVDARTSDAIALAVRSDCEIFIKEDIMNIVGMEVEAADSGNQQKEEVGEIDAEQLTPEELDMLSLEDLEELLNMAINEEKYELAVNLRDAIKRKKTA
ncbi:MAG: bifunctional nuclease family protein [Paludibacter sp.]|nr:bifunctional nuclease family protein [Paludibacter sp.]MDD4198573.1 bifunctional nuclease family protein [Paludibacter sp.]MDD4428451.1 bifunctional nuclease family protein [Paludibacter sp.]